MASRARSAAVRPPAALLALGLVLAALAGPEPAPAASRYT